MDKTIVSPLDVHTSPWRFNEAIKVRGASYLVSLSGIVGYDHEQESATTLPRVAGFAQTNSPLAIKAIAVLEN